MTPDEGWHLARPQVAQYVNGRTSLAQAASVEAHLTACDYCRSMLNGVLPEMAIDRMWQRILSTVDPPAAGRCRRAVEHLRKRSAAAPVPRAVLRIRHAGFAAIALALGLAVTGPQHPSSVRDSGTPSSSSPTSPARTPLPAEASVDGPLTIQGDDTTGRPRSRRPGPTPGVFTVSRTRAAAPDAGRPTTSPPGSGPAGAVAPERGDGSPLRAGSRAI